MPTQNPDDHPTYTSLDNFAGFAWVQHVGNENSVRGTSQALQNFYTKSASLNDSMFYQKQPDNKLASCDMPVPVAKLIAPTLFNLKGKPVPENSNVLKNLNAQQLAVPAPSANQVAAAKDYLTMRQNLTAANNLSPDEQYKLDSGFNQLLQNGLTDGNILNYKQDATGIKSNMSEDELHNFATNLLVRNGNSYGVNTAVKASGNNNIATNT